MVFFVALWILMFLPFIHFVSGAPNHDHDQRGRLWTAQQHTTDAPLSSCLRDLAIDNISRYSYSPCVLEEKRKKKQVELTNLSADHSSAVDLDVDSHDNITRVNRGPGSEDVFLKIDHEEFQRYLRYHRGRK